MYRALTVAGLLGLGATSAMGQAQLDRFERQLEQIRRDTRLLVRPDVPPEQRALIDYGGYASFYFLALDDPTGNTHLLRQSELNGYFRADIDGVHQVFIRGRVGYQDFNQGDDFDGKGDEWIDATLDRASYTFDLRRASEAYKGETLPYNFVFTGGRQLVHWANGLVLSEDIDGAVVDLEYGPGKLELLLGRTRPDQVDIDSARPNFEDSTHRNFFGAMMSCDLADGDHTPYLYGLVQQDDNPDDTVTVGGTNTNFDYNSFYVGFGSKGKITDYLRYGVEFAYEGGTSLSSAFVNTGGVFTGVTQTKEDISAWAVDARLDYFLHDQAGTFFSGELILATGDSDRVLSSSSSFGGNTPGTKDHAFNAFGLLNTGLAFSPDVSNLFVMRVGAATYPLRNTEWFRRLQIGVDLFLFNKFNPDGPIDEATNAGDRYLGFESDFYANWQITSDLAVSARYGVFFPGSGIVDADSDIRHFFFTGLTVAF
ncbi:MAG: hypothetical protein GC162_09280 [Planctomycetes bacterium]|nr:hypothetical protein [Planctomycetota bacterium]